jgi:molecular chaperone Hsp33
LTMREEPLFGAKAAEDDRLLPFAVEALDLRGRVVRLGPTVNTILSHYAHPPPVARALGEATALTALLGSMLESHGRFQLQTRSDGPIHMLVVDYKAPGLLRGCVRYDADRVNASAPTSDLLGRGHMALTIERDEDASRYQGVVALEKEGLAAAAYQYFRQSEQIPSFVRLAVAEIVTPRGHSWRAGGIILQFLPAGRAENARAEENGAPESWMEGVALGATIEDHELVDPSVSPERLLYRLFHERGVKVFRERPLTAYCDCSSERVRDMLRSFSQEDRAYMVGDDGRIGVTCEFCGGFRSFDPQELD